MVHSRSMVLPFLGTMRVGPLVHWVARYVARHVWKSSRNVLKRRIGHLLTILHSCHERISHPSPQNTSKLFSQYCCLIRMFAILGWVLITRVLLFWYYCATGSLSVLHCIGQSLPNSQRRKIHPPKIHPKAKSSSEQVFFLTISVGLLTHITEKQAEVRENFLSKKFVSTRCLFGICGFWWVGFWASKTWVNVCNFYIEMLSWQMVNSNT